MNETEGRMMGMLNGHIAIVTGAGRGIGAAAAHLFAAEGASVVVCDLDPSPAERTAAAIREAGGRVIVVAGDVTDPAFPPPPYVLELMAPALSSVSGPLTLTLIAPASPAPYELLKMPG